VLDSCCELNAPLIRVWAGACASSNADENYRNAVIADSQRIAEVAARAGKRVAFEYHGGTLTDSRQSAKALLEAVTHPAVGCYWQPPVGMEHDECLEGLGDVVPRLSGLHVFTWRRTESGCVRHPLRKGQDEWMDYFRKASEAGSDTYALLEFVKDDQPEQFLEDAAALLNMLKRLPPTRSTNSAL